LKNIAKLLIEPVDVVIIKAAEDRWFTFEYNKSEDKKVGINIKKDERFVKNILVDLNPEWRQNLVSFLKTP
jgi:hypothetical protein